jgi:hypothetical protein
VRRAAPRAAGYLLVVAGVGAVLLGALTSGAPVLQPTPGDPAPLHAARERAATP